jgi:glycerate kinase
VRVLVAPDKFRGTLTAIQAAAALAEGWRRSRPRDEVETCPVADGGEGTMWALLAALGGRAVAAGARGPLGERIGASVGLAEPGGTRLAIVESASASGLALLPETARDALRAGTAGTGDLIRAALDLAPERILLCVGGTASTDGGAGMAMALGARLARADGTSIGAGGSGLLELAAVDVSSLDPRLRAVDLDVCVDVDNPLTGPTGAGAAFGPQKGASPADVVLLDRALGHLAAVVHRDLGVDLRGRPGSGAGGGLAFGTAVFLGGRIRSGAGLVSEVLGLEARVRRADVVITGEGRFDRGTLRGKAPAEVLRLAREAGAEPVVVCGEAERGVRELVPGLGRVVSLTDRFGAAAASADAAARLTDLGAEIAATIAEERGTDAG